MLFVLDNSFWISLYSQTIRSFDSFFLVSAAAAAAAAVTSGPSSVVRRQKRSAPKEEPEKVDEEEWSLKDVIFVEDSPNFPMIGKVLKVMEIFW